MIRASSANRGGWLAHGRPVWDLIVGPLRAAIAWALEDPDTRTLGLITYQVLAVAIRAALAPQDPAHRAAWKALDQSPAQLDAGIAALAPILARWDRAPIEALHYGPALRGFNGWETHDALITLGDPWLNLGEVRHEAQYLGLDPDERGLARCQAELEQAHGRLRTASRTTKARALHVGVVLPGGSGWTDAVSVRALDTGRPANASAMAADELAGCVAHVGGARALARLLGGTSVAIGRYLSSARQVPAALAVAIRALTRLDA